MKQEEAKNKAELAAMALDELLGRTSTEIITINNDTYIRYKYQDENQIRQSYIVKLENVPF